MTICIDRWGTRQKKGEKRREEQTTERSGREREREEVVEITKVVFWLAMGWAKAKTKGATKPEAGLVDEQSGVVGASSPGSSK